MKRIGILGGSFNPVHLGHLNIARVAADSFQLDKVLFIPCKVSPFKIGEEPDRVVGESDRLRMIELTIEADPRFELSRIEIDRGGISYSFDTVNAVQKYFPEARLFFIIGSDSLLSLALWHNIDALSNMCEFVTVERPGVNYNDFKTAGLPAKLIESLSNHRVTGKLLDISSTDVRSKLADGESITGMVDPAVEQYIADHQLYRR
ncbi:MAG: nicotinate-nucleotide adenylyltransferase [Petrimonas sp.]|jgi:nicotinate-nucleotide adenylyltransferase|nr:nicotinate-nucleotide adenylyltransferase [Petrimonas sp.]